MSDEIKLRPGQNFSLACIHCDAGQEIHNEATALNRGWTDLQADDGLGWTVLGICPDCNAEERP